MLTLQIINLYDSSEEEPETDLENEFFSFGVPDLGCENNVIKLLRSFYHKEMSL